MAKIVQVDGDALSEAAAVIRGGGVIVLPTDTVYGVACDPTNEEAVGRIYRIKHRPRSKALQVLLSSVGQLAQLQLSLPSPLDLLSKRLLPGAFSPIALAGSDSALVTLHPELQGGRTQAIRVPDSEVSLRIIEATGPLAATSANQSGDESAQTADEAYAALGDSVDLYLDGGPTSSHVASTVVAADNRDGDGIAVLREGVIPAASIRALLHEADAREQGQSHA